MQSNRRELKGFDLSVELCVEIEGVTQEEAEELVDQAHEVCPYSRAIEGNVNVKKTVKAL